MIAWDVIEGRLIEIGLRALELGGNVVLDYGLSSRQERSALRQAAEPHTTWAAAFEAPTPGELDGREPVDRPPTGFDTWDEWRAHRWSPSVA